MTKKLTLSFAIKVSKRKFQIKYETRIVQDFNVRHDSYNVHVVIICAILYVTIHL